MKKKNRIRSTWSWSMEEAITIVLYNAYEGRCGT